MITIRVIVIDVLSSHVAVAAYSSKFDRKMFPASLSSFPLDQNLPPSTVLGYNAAMWYILRHQVITKMLNLSVTGHIFKFPSVRDSFKCFRSFDSLSFCEILSSRFRVPSFIYFEAALFYRHYHVRFD